MKYTLYLLLLFISLHATAQYKQHQPLRDFYRQKAIGNERVWQRVTVGAGIQFFPGTFDLMYSGADTLGKPFDTSLSVKPKSKRSLVIHAGSFFPIALLSDNSMLVVNIEAMASYTELTVDSAVFNTRRVYNKAEPIIIGGVEIGLDYKTGGEVSLSKRDKTSFTIGGGFNFCGYTNYLEEPELPVKAVPFLKAEIGFFAGLEFKIRGMAYLGRANFIDRYTYNVINSDLADELHTKSNTGFGYSLSLMLLPLSYGWR